MQSIPAAAGGEVASAEVGGALVGAGVACRPQAVISSAAMTSIENAYPIRLFIFLLRYCKTGRCEC
jgi:hypothetical protein